MGPLIFLTLMIWTSVARADVQIVSRTNNYAVDLFPDVSADFGPELTSNGMLGLLVRSEPEEACEEVPPPPMHRWGINPVGNWFLLVKHYYNCSFVNKVLNAQKAGYHAVIVYNSLYDNTNPIECDTSTEQCNEVDIPTVLVSRDDGFILSLRYLFNQGFYIFLTDESIDIVGILKTFGSVCAVVFICLLLCIVMCKIIQWINNRRRLNKHRMPLRSLKKLVTKRYSKGDPYDMCAVCLEDYSEGDKLRVLPCAHVYHTKCIDPWLTKNKRVCPCCKRKVFAEDEKPADLESSDTDLDEHTPLLRPTPNVQSSTGRSYSNNRYPYVCDDNSGTNVSMEEGRGQSQHSSADNCQRPPTVV